ncbi:MAG: hypothetical protein PVSMB8_00570 [Vulcanimicrobiaceae bacterium]
MGYDVATNDALLAALIARCEGRFEFFVGASNGQLYIHGDRPEAKADRIGLNIVDARLIQPKFPANARSITWVALYPIKYAVGDAGLLINLGTTYLPLRMDAACDAGLLELGRGIVLAAARDYFDAVDLRRSASGIPTSPP